MPPVLRVVVAVAVASALCSACTTQPSERDAEADRTDDGAARDALRDGVGAVDAGSETDSVRDADARPASGPLTTLTDSIRLGLERYCDLDGDGDEDNSVADLGSPLAEMLAMAVDAALAGAIEDGVRTLYYLPWVDDLAGPNDDSAVLIAFQGIDTDDDLTDDFSGTEEYFAGQNSIDGCGEPLHYSEDVRYVDGHVAGTLTTLPIPLSEGGSTPRLLVAHDVILEGQVEPWGESSDSHSCAHFLARELAELPGLRQESTLSMLEVFVAGGITFGLALPGITPDIDVDGDGLERFETNDAGEISCCIDGDRTIVEGRDCWRDERFADGFSFVVEMTTTAARFAGRLPGWDVALETTCPEGPPEPSLFDPS